MILVGPYFSNRKSISCSYCNDSCNFLPFGGGSLDLLNGGVSWPATASAILQPFCTRPSPDAHFHLVPPAHPLMPLHTCLAARCTQPPCPTCPPVLCLQTRLAAKRTLLATSYTSHNTPSCAAHLSSRSRCQQLIVCMRRLSTVQCWSPPPPPPSFA